MVLRPLHLLLIWSLLASLVATPLPPVTAATTDNATRAASVRAEAPVIETRDAIEISPLTAKLVGNLISKGTALMPIITFLWGTASGNYTVETPEQGFYWIGLYTAKLSGLSPGTTYYFRAKVVGDGTHIGAEKSLTTLPAPWEWQRTFGGVRSDNFGMVRQTSDGGYIAVGFTEPPAPYGSPYNIDVYLVKTDSSGNLTWSRTFGGTGIDGGNSVQQTADGGYILVGNADFGVGNRGVYLVKTEASGNMTWSKTFSGTYALSIEEGRSVHQTADGGYIIAGRTTSYSAGYDDAYLIKTDSSGNKTWQRSFGGVDGDEGNSVQQTSDGGYIIGGKKWIYAYSWVHGWGYYSDAWLIKTDASGNLTWEKRFGGSPSDSAESVRQTSDGGYIIAGWTYSAGDGNNSDFYLIKTDAQGDMVWTRAWGDTVSDALFSVQQTADGGYVVAGVGSYESNNVYVAKTDDAGNVVWSKHFGGSDFDGAYSAQQTSDGGYIIAGYTASFSTGEPNFRDAWLVKLSPQQERPTVATSAATGVTHGGATLNGNLTWRGTAPSDNVSFQWGLSTNFTAETPPQSASATGPFSFTLSGLSSNTTYHYRAKASGHGIACGDNMTFTTLSPTPPLVVTDNATSISGRSALLNGTLTSLGTSGNVTLSFQWGTSTNYTGETAPFTTTAPGPFNLYVTGLSENTTYHFRAKAVGVRTAYGDDMSFTTAGTPTVASAYAWGDNSYGQLGDNTTTDRYTPAPVRNLSSVVAISAGEWHSLALRSDGTVRAWGYNTFGQVGDNTTIDRYTPVPVQNLSGVIALSAGWYQSLALKSDGTAWAWGDNTVGQLGDNTTTSRYTPIQVSSLSGLTGVSTGGLSLAVRPDGMVWAWGHNRYGGLGDNTTTDRHTPVSVQNLTGATAVSAGGYHSLALKSDGTVWAWDSNRSGQLGDNTTTDRLTPVRVQDLAGVTAVSAGSGWHSLALKSDGTVWAWGSNSSGQLGDSSTTTRLTPVQVQSLTGITAISAGQTHSLALKSDGTVWAWGYNYNGQLGDNTTTNRSTPAPVPNLTGVIAVSAGSYHSLAIRNVESARISGTAYEARGVALSGVTLTLNSSSNATSDSIGVYELSANTTGTRTLVASKSGFRSLTQTVNITDMGAAYTVDFKGDSALVPNAPDLSYVLACVNRWKFPPADGTGLGISRMLAVVNAWKFPVQLKVHFINVGQGDAILLDYGTTEVLIDGGERSSGVVNYLRGYVDGNLEAMVATHPHADHIGGLIDVLAAFRVERVYWNGQEVDTDTYREFKAAAVAEVQSSLPQPRRGNSISVGGLTFYVLNPPAPPFTGSDNINNNSIVLKLREGDIQFLFTGDAERAAETSMLAAGLPLSAQVLKVGHHGSNTSSTRPFLDAVSPQYAVIMAGAGNQYHHPHAETVQALNDVGARVYGTHVHGTIKITTDGTTVTVSTDNQTPPLAAPRPTPSPVAPVTPPTAIRGHSTVLPAVVARNKASQALRPVAGNGIYWRGQVLNSDFVTKPSGGGRDPDGYPTLHPGSPRPPDFIGTPRDDRQGILIGPQTPDRYPSPNPYHVVTPPTGSLSVGKRFIGSSRSG